MDVREINSTQYTNKIAETVVADKFAWPVEQKYPLDSESNIKEAAAYFDRYHKEFDDISKKLEYAVNTKIAASKFDIDVSTNELTKYANLSTDIFNKKFIQHINIRQSYLNDQDSIEVYDDLIKRAEELGPVQTAEVMYALDKKADLTRTYGKGVEDPILSTLSNNAGQTDTIDGILVKHSELSHLDEGALTKLVGNDVITELKGEDGLAVLKSLPKPVRNAILDELNP